jgi:prepilin-type N-terminal cleavage/methylation domain-containing protein
MTPTIRNLKSQVSDRKSQSPGGFTLVEILVVIAIIGMLVGLLVPAINAARATARRTVIKADMAQLVLAIERFRTSIGGGQYPPDGTSTPDLQQFCTAAWPRVYWIATGKSNYNATPPQVLYPTVTPDTALCFWLGGAQDSSGTTSSGASTTVRFTGFSANPTNPFDNSPSRVQPSFEFPTDTTRLVESTTASGVSNGSTTVYWNLYYYYPPNNKATSANQPYVYFKPVVVTPGQAPQYTSTPIQPGSSANSSGNTTLPYKDSTTSTTAAQMTFVNPQMYQLLCPGLDGKYGNYGLGSGNVPNYPQYPAGGNYDATSGIDDQTNFTNGPTVGSDSQ